MHRLFRDGLSRLVALFAICAACAFGFGAPAIMNYQAKLTDSNGVPITAAVSIAFTFWDAESGGNQLGGGFSDTDVVTPSSFGVVSTDVGDDPGIPIPSSVFASNSVWLNVNVNGSDIAPRQRIASVGYAINALPLYGGAHVITEVTTSALANGQNLKTAYAWAKLLTPNGLPLSATNRAVVLIAPGNYDLGSGQLILDTQFVDLVGLSSKAEDQYIHGDALGSGHSVLRQTANDVGMENLRVNCTRATGATVNNDSTDPAAYFPVTETSFTVVRNCRFEALNDSEYAFGMRLGVDYQGTYKDCVGGYFSFGGYGGNASGTFTNCTGGVGAFGGYGAGTASGKFINCIGGGDSFGGGGVGRVSGTFTACTGNNGAFGGGSSNASGAHFYYCKGGANSFGGSGSPTYLYCIRNNAAYP